MGVSFYNGQICAEGIICGSFIEIGITFIALLVIYVAYEVIYKKPTKAHFVITEPLLVFIKICATYLIYIDKLYMGGRERLG